MQQNQGQKGSLHVIPNQYAQDCPVVLGRVALLSICSPNFCLHTGLVFKCDETFIRKVKDFQSETGKFLLKWRNQ